MSCSGQTSQTHGEPPSNFQNFKDLLFTAWCESLQQTLGGLEESMAHWTKVVWQETVVQPEDNILLDSMDWLHPSPLQNRVPFIISNAAFTWPWSFTDLLEAKHTTITILFWCHTAFTVCKDSRRNYSLQGNMSFTTVIKRSVDLCVQRADQRHHFLLQLCRRRPSQPTAEPNWTETVPSFMPTRLLQMQSADTEIHKSHFGLLMPEGGHARLHCQLVPAVEPVETLIVFKSGRKSREAMDVQKGKTVYESTCFTRST